MRPLGPLDREPWMLLLWLLLAQSGLLNLQNLSAPRYQLFLLGQLIQLHLWGLWGQQLWMQHLLHLLGLYRLGNLWDLSGRWGPSFLSGQSVRRLSNQQ